MKKPVMPWSFSGLIRFFCACFFALLCCAPAGAAELEWQALPDRERVSIRMDQSEGVAGDVARIAPTGVIIPFSEVPPGLFVGAAPEGASIFKGTRQQGRSLILETQTAEFGFVLSSKTATSLVVDFFHNPLGARWKASSKAPTTEIPPDFAIPPMAPADEVSVALSTDPEGTSAASVALASGRSGSAPTPPAAPDRQSNATSATPPAAATPDATARPVDPNRARPVVVALSGTPDHASTVTRMADAPPTVASPTPVIGPQSQAKAAAPATPALPPPVLDSRTQTQERSAPLPLPEPPLSVSVAAPRTDRDAGESPAERQPSPVAQVEAATAASEPEARSPTGPAASPAVAPIAPSSPPATRSAATPAPVAASPSPPTAPPVGVGVPTGSGIYGGLINTGGLEALPPDGADGYRDSPVEPPASSAGEAAGEAAEEVNGTAASSVEDSGSPAEPVQSREIDVPASPESRGGKDVPPQDNATVIYLDEEGKPVEPPPKPEVMLPEMRGRIGKGDFAGALGIAEDLLARATLDKDQREEVLHARAEMLFALNKDDLGPSYREISDATNQAISFNSKSLRNAGAHLRLGFMNLKMGNLPEAEAHFNMLRRLYPNDENVPLSYYYWGDYHFGRGEVQKAADEFQYVLQEYTNSRYAREAALGLARSFYRLGYYEQSFNVVDYIERRWERFYLQYPPFLNMIGDVAFRLGKLDYALKNYWLYINLEPAGAEADIILTRMGDIYGMQREKKAAQELYNESLSRFPDKDGGLVAMMRLAEEGVNDDPTIAGMFSVFDGPFSLRPMEVYRNIIQKHPESSLVPLAEVKLSLWHLWKKEYTETLDILSDFMRKYPKHELAPRAREIAMQTFAVLSAESMQEGRYARMRDIWERYPIVREQGQILTPESRIALGVSYRHDGKPDEALRTVEPFFLGERIPEYSEMALSLVLSIYLEHNQWNSIREVARRVELWEIKPESARQLDYALALAAENLGEPEKAAPIWQKLYDSGTLPPAQMAYAAFFLAREAERTRQLEKSFFLGQEALSRLLTQVQSNPNAADVGKIQTQLASLMDVSEVAGRLREALGFAQQYLEYLEPGDPERNAVYYRMARVYKKQGDTDSWKKTLQNIVSSDPASVYGQIAASELKAASLAEDAARFSPTGSL